MRIIVLAGGWLLGLYVGSETGLSPAAAAPVTGGALLLVWLMRGRWRWLMIAIFILGLTSGVLRFTFQGDLDPGGGLHLLNGGTSAIEVRGVVDSFPETAGSATRFRLAVREVRLQDSDWTTVSGKVLVTAKPPRELVLKRDPPYFRQGDLFGLKGDLEQPESFGDFDFPRFLARQGVGSTMAFPRLSLLGTGHGPTLDRWVSSVRDRLARSLRQALPEPQASLAQALALGIRSDIPSDLEQDFRDTGTTHLLAISGLHVGMVMLAALWASRRLFARPRFLVFLLPALVAWGYALLAGMPPSASRAAFMGTFYLGALYFGRQRHGREALLLAALVITAFDPAALWEVSFQLSFLAMAGIILALDWTRGLWAGAGGESPGALRWASMVAIMGVAATLLTWPAIGFYFKQVSLVGVPATLAALPAIPVALAFSLAAAIVGLASSEAAWLFAWGAWLTLGYFQWVVELAASLPLTSVRFGGVSRWLVVAYYGLLSAGLWLLSRGTGLPRLGAVRITPPSGLRLSRFGALILAVSLLSALVWTSALRGPSGTLEVTFLDVGHGDAILIRTPSRHIVLVDGGRDPRLIAQALGRHLPFWNKRIEVLVASHGHEDHVGGLAEVVERFDVRQVLAPPGDYGLTSMAAWRRAVDRRDIPLVVAREGQTIRLGNTRIDVLHPPERLLESTPSDVDNNSVVLRVSYGQVSFLLTGDVHALAETFLVETGAGLESTVLKAGHHGSRTSSSEPFLDAVRPLAVVTTSDEERTFGHPHPETLAALGQRVPAGALFDTGLQGEVRFETDGRRLWVTTARD